MRKLIVMILCCATAAGCTPAEGRHRGLLIVEALTSKWGTQATPTGKVVWAELLVPAGSTPDQPVGAGDRPTEG